MSDLVKDGVNYQSYLDAGLQVYELMKGNKSGARGKQRHLEAAKLVFDTLQKIIEDIPAIERQLASSHKEHPSGQAFFKDFLDAERYVMKQSGLPSEYSENWIKAAKKVVDIDNLEEVDINTLRLVLGEKLRVSERIIEELEGDIELNRKHRRALLRLSYVVGSIGVFGANSLVLPSVYPIFVAWGTSLSQKISIGLISASVIRLPGLGR